MSISQPPLICARVGQSKQASNSSAVKAAAFAATGAKLQKPPTQPKVCNGFAIWQKRWLTFVSKVNFCCANSELLAYVSILL